MNHYDRNLGLIGNTLSLQKNLAIVIFLKPSGIAIWPIIRSRIEESEKNGGSPTHWTPFLRSNTFANHYEGNLRSVGDVLSWHNKSANFQSPLV